MTLALFICLTAPAENGRETANQSTQNTRQGSSENDSDNGQNGSPGIAAVSANIGDISLENYADIIKEAFDLDVVPADGWQVTKAIHPNGVNNVDLIKKGAKLWNDTKN